MLRLMPDRMILWKNICGRQGGIKMKKIGSRFKCQFIWKSIDVGFFLSDDLSLTTSLSDSSSPKVAVSSPCTVRSRVKEFPAGNNATSASRITFLQSLCKHPKFTFLVDTIQPMVSSLIYLKFFNISIFLIQPKHLKIPIEYPAWASWKSKEIFLPPEIFKTTLGLVWKEMTDLSRLDPANVDAPLSPLYQKVHQFFKSCWSPI